MRTAIPHSVRPAGRARRSPAATSPEYPVDRSAGILLAENKDLAARKPGLIDRLREEDRRRVLRYSHRRTLKRHELLFAQGDPHDGIVTIESGRIRSFYTAPSGREITLAYWFPGNFIGGPNVFGGGTHMWAAAAVQTSEVTVLPGRPLRELAATIPDLALGLIDALAFKATCYSTVAQMLGTRSIGERLAQLLMFLANTYGIDEANGIFIAVSFSHSDLAHLVGATRQWVTISLTRLQKAGVVQYRRGMLLIRKPEQLAAVCSRIE